MKRIVIALALVAPLAGCGLFNGESKPKTALLGERIPVLVSETGAEIDPSLADVPVTVPEPTPNTEWAQSGGNAQKSMGHLALGQTLSKAWTARIAGGNVQMRLGSPPVVADGRVYAVDTRARVHAFNAATGAKIWERQIGDEKDTRGGLDFLSGEYTGNSASLFGGGVSFDGGKVFATSGIGDVAAFDAATGNQLWLKRPGGPLRGAPTVAGGSVYVMTQDNQLFALDEENGGTRWNVSGTLEVAGVFGVAAPSVAQGTVISGFSSGELTAYRYENGRVLWQDALSRTSISTSVSSLSDVDADPVIDGGRVYSIGQGGRMIALELVTGQRLWELNIAGISTPWVAGDWLFVVTDEAQLLCVSRANGRVRWITQLPRWRDEKDRKGPISWSGPVLAGNRLILTGTNGQIASVGLDGGRLPDGNAEAPVSLPPVVAGGTVYILSNDGRLTAWR